jgi:hypothetical protein
MSTTSVVAWWGAILSTIVFGWDIYKYRTAGPKLRFTVQPDMKTINVPTYEGKTVMMARVTNYGDRPTTITNLCYEYFEKKRKKIPDKAAVILTPSVERPLPFELKAGGVWNGVAVQDAEVKEWATTGILEMILYHSHSEKPIRQRIVIKKNHA